MHRPLAGMRVILTRPADKNDALATALLAAGAIPIALPLIAIGPPPDPVLLRARAERSSEYDAIAFTSANGVAAFAAAARRGHAARGVTSGAMIAAVGPATARAVRAHLGCAPDVVPTQPRGDALARALARRLKRGARVAIFQAQDAHPALATRLREAGYDVAAIAAYATLLTPPSDLALRVRASDAIVLASGSAARSLASGLRAQSDLAALDGVTIACIGPVTADDARACGLTVHAVARRAEPAALIDALAGSARRFSG